MKGNEYIDKKAESNSKGNKKRKKKRFSKPRTQASQTFVEILNGDFLTKEFVLKNLAYIFFIMFLLILIISKGYYVNQTATDIKKTEEKLGEITADYVESKAKVEEATRRTELIEKLAPIGLRETVNPTKVIRKKDSKK